MALGNAGSFIVDTLASTLVPITTGNFTVDVNAVRLEASGLSGDDVVKIQILVGPNNATTTWQDLFLAGEAVQMDALNTQRIIVLGGKYRAVYEGSAEVTVYQESDRLELDKNVFYTYTQPNSASGGGGGGGFTLTADDTDSVDLTYSGTTSSGTLTADVRISAVDGNIISTLNDGIYAEASAAGAIPFSAETADFAVELTSHSHTITVGSEDTVVATLPPAADAAGQVYYIEAAGLGVTTIAPDGVEVINSVVGAVNLTSGTASILISNSTNGWLLVKGAA